ncbi:MAG: putative inorganic carbon transporter subunit DabA, partial [Opitutales bacterium]
PVQALAAPDRPIHEALRLHVCLEASTEAIDAVLAKHASVRELVEHRWIHLFALVEHGTKLVQRKAKGGWAPVQNGARLARADQERAKSASARDRA